MDSRTETAPQSNIGLPFLLLICSRGELSVAKSVAYSADTYSQNLSDALHAHTCLILSSSHIPIWVVKIHMFCHRSPIQTDCSLYQRYPTGFTGVQATRIACVSGVSLSSY